MLFPIGRGRLGGLDAAAGAFFSHLARVSADYQPNVAGHDAAIVTQFGTRSGEREFAGPFSDRWLHHGDQ